MVESNITDSQWRREELRAGGGISKNGRKVWSKATALESSQNWVGVMKIFSYKWECAKIMPFLTDLRQFPNNSRVFSKSNRLAKASKNASTNWRFILQKARQKTSIRSNDFRRTRKLNKKFHQMIELILQDSSQEKEKQIHCDDENEIN
jgi:hypothetical protein